MLSPHGESQHIISEDCSFEDECIDDIKPELISFTLSGSASSCFSFEESSQYIENTISYGSSPVYTEKETSDSFIIILNTLSGKDEISSAETLITHDNVKTLSIDDMSVAEELNVSKTENVESTQILDSNEYNHQADVKNTFHCPRPEESYSKSQAVPKTKLSLSMNDVSTFPEFPLKKKCKNVSPEVFESQSMTSVSCCQKSRDSGLPRSFSCLSLHSGSKSYDHIQSKVKEYIRQIKETEGNRKSKKSEDITRKSNNLNNTNNLYSESKQLVSEQDLTEIVKDLHTKLEDKEAVLSKLQENYDKLLLKYAEAENRIDHLRFKVIDSSLEVPSKNLGEEESNRQFSSLFEDHSESVNSMNSVMPYTNSDSKHLQADIDLFNSANVSSVKQTTHEKSHLSHESQELNSKKNLNPIVNIYSSSSRLDGKLEPLAHNLELKSFEHTLVPIISKEIALVGNTFNGNSEEQISNLKSNFINSVINNRYKKNFDKSNENLKLEDRRNCKQDKNENSYDSKKLKYEVHHDTLKECCSDITQLSGECELPKDIAAKSDAYLQHSILCAKVAKWQECLPPSEIVEQSHYGSFDCDSNRNKTVNQFLKKFTSPDGRDSGCPCSELCNLSIQQNSNFFLHQITDLDQNTFSQQQQPACHTNPYYSVSDSYTAVSNTCILPQLLNMETNTDMNVTKNTEVSPNSINTCECWLLEKPSDDSKESSNSKVFQKYDFDIPPLKLGSLIDDSSNITDNIYSNDISNVSGSENMLDSCTVFDESSISSQKETSEDITSSTLATSVTGRNHVSKIYPTNCSNVLKNVSISERTLEEIYINGNTADVNMQLQNDSPQPVTTTISYKNIHVQPYMNILGKCFSSETQARHLDYSLPSTPTSYRNVVRSKTRNLKPEVKQEDYINDSIEPSATTSTSYISLQPYKNVIENYTLGPKNQERKNTKHFKVVSDTCRSQTAYSHDSTSKQIHCSPQNNTCCSSTQCDQRQSDASKKRILGIALRILMIHFLNSTEKCDRSGCICNRLIKHNVSSVNIQTQTDEASFCAPTPHDSSSNIKSKVSMLLNSKNKYLATKSKNMKDQKPEILCSDRKKSKRERGNNCNKLYCNNEVLCNGEDIGNDGCDLRCRKSVKETHFKEGDMSNKDIARKQIFSSTSNESSSSKQSTEEAHTKLRKCLEEMDHIAQQLNASSEKILNILAVQQKSSS